MKKSNNILQVDQTVQLGDRKYVVRTGNTANYYYLGILNPAENNERFFLDLKFSREDKLNIQKQVLGYRTSGQFPECRSLEDLTKFYHYLKVYEPLLGRDFKKVKIVPNDVKNGTWHIDSDGVAKFNPSTLISPNPPQIVSNTQNTNPLHKNLLPVTQRLVIK